MLRSAAVAALRRTGPWRDGLLAAAFWALAVVALLNLRELHLGGMPGVKFVGALATMICCPIVVGLAAIRESESRREPVWSVAFWRRSVGMPGLFLFAAVASWLAIGAAVLAVDGNWQPDTAGHLRYRLLYFGVLVAAALGGRAMLERAGADRLLRGVLAILTASCAVILASPILRELGVVALYRHPFRLTGAFTNANEAGLVGCMAVTLALAMMNNGGSRKLGHAGLAIGTAATLATASRTAFFVLLAVLVWFALLDLRAGRRAVFLLSWAGGVIGVAVVAVQMTLWTEYRVSVNQSLAGPMFCEPPADDRAGAVPDCAVLLAVKDILVGGPADQPAGDPAGGPPNGPAGGPAGSPLDIPAGDATGGPALNWSRTLPVQRWEGVTLQEGPAGRVIGLSLKGWGLRGRIPPELGRLRHLVALLLDRNRLTGAIPAELGNLANLRYLGLGFNQLSGAIPPELAELPDLEKLWLGYNGLTGSVPPGLGRSGSLVLVRFAGNDLDRPFPPALRAVEDHDLVCDLPARDQAGAVPDCAVLLAVRDILVGGPTGGPTGGSAVGDPVLNWSRTAPVQRWEGVTWTGPDERVTRLNLQSRALHGRVPPELGRLQDLDALLLNRNRLTGSIPPELGNLANLRYLGLAFNRLSGAIPPELAMLPNLEQLWLRGNRLTGPVPPELGQSGSLVLMRLAGNDLDRPFPATLRAVADHDLDNTMALSAPETPAVVRPADSDIAGADTAAMDGPGSGVLPGKIGAALANQRLLLWGLGFEKAMEAPLFGHGLRAMTSLESAPAGHHGDPLGVHNLYLALLGEAGIVPLSLFLLAVFLSLRSHWHAPKSLSRDTAVGWTAVIALHGLTSHHILLVVAAMFLAGLGVALAAPRDQGGVAMAPARDRGDIRPAQS